MPRFRIISGTGPASPAAVILFALILAGVPARPAHAGVINEAMAVANWKGAAVRSDISSQSVPVSPSVMAVRLSTTVNSVRQAFPGIYQVEYSLRAENTGTATLNAITISDDPVQAFSPARLLNRPDLAVAGFSGSGQNKVVPNPAFDGMGEKNMLSGHARLAPGETGEVSIRLNVASTPGELGFDASAHAIAAGLAEPVESDTAAAGAGIIPQAGGQNPSSGDLSARMESVFEPVAQADGWALAAYRLTISAGNKPVDELSVREDLAAGFGAGKFRVVALVVRSTPEDFAATANPFFNGDSDTELLTSGGDLKPGETIVLDLTLTFDAEGTADGRFLTTDVRAGGFGVAEPDGTASVVARLPIRLPEAARREIAVTLRAEPGTYRPGERIGVALDMTGKISAGGDAVDLIVEMPEGFSYLPGTASLSGEPWEPAVAEGAVAWAGVEIAAGDAEIRFELAAGAETGEGLSALRAYGRAPGSGRIVSDVAETALQRDADAVFDCVEIAGLVFEDRSRDGYRQDNEAGVAGVEIARSGGASVLSGRDGGFRFACPTIARSEFGKRAELTLRLESLPPGYHSTTDDTVRLDLKRGRTATAGFGLARLRPVAFRIDESAFATGGTELTPQALAILAGLINRLEERSSILQIIYRGDPADELAQRRVEAVRALADGGWRADQRPFSLNIETTIEK